MIGILFRWLGSAIPSIIWILIAALLSGSVFLTTPAGAEDPSWWPRFRGPDGSGISEDSKLPARFDATTNVLWKTPLPMGHSSPVVWENRIFLTAFANDQLETLCVDRTSGQIRWRKQSPLRDGTVPKVRNVNSRASPTPTVDGKAVYVYFDAFGLLAYDLDGEQIWTKPLPKAKQPWGVGSSPVVAGKLLLLNVDQDINSYLLALDADSGKTVWRSERVEFRRGWSTPLVVGQQVIVAGSLRLVAYDLTDGHEIWSVHGLPYQVSPSPSVAGGVVYMAAWDAGGVGADFNTYVAQYDKDKSGTISADEYNFMWDFPKFDRDKDKQVTRQEFDELVNVFHASRISLLAIRPDGRGNVTETHVNWEASSSLPHVPSVLIYRGLVYTVCNGGILCCYDADSGTQHYRTRLAAGGNYYASPVAADGKVYLASQKGVVSVVRAGPQYELIHKADFNNDIMATPAIIENMMLIRTGDHLYAIGP